MYRYFGKAVLLAFFASTAATSGFAENQLIFPIVAYTNTDACTANCTYWTSFTSVFNPNAEPATLTFALYDSSGKLISSSGPVTAGGFQTASIPSSMPLRTGWLKVTSSQPLVGREYLQYYRVAGGVQDLRSRINLSPAGLSRTHFISPESLGPVGISIVFPSAANQSPARGKLIHRETDGSVVSERDLVLGGNGQLIAYLRELVPASEKVPPEPLQGSFEIVFDQDVAVAALQFAASEPLEEPVNALAGTVASQ